jgi:hypothetical protein
VWHGVQQCHVTSRPIHNARTRKLHHVQHLV